MIVHRPPSSGARSWIPRHEKGAAAGRLHERKPSQGRAYGDARAEHDVVTIVNTSSRPGSRGRSSWGRTGDDGGAGCRCRRARARRGSRVSITSSTRRLPDGLGPVPDVYIRVVLVPLSRTIISIISFQHQQPNSKQQSRLPVNPAFKPSFHNKSPRLSQNQTKPSTCIRASSPSSPWPPPSPPPRRPWRSARPTPRPSSNAATTSRSSAASRSPRRSST